jgi:hypothetical protein
VMSHAMQSKVGAQTKVFFNALALHPMNSSEIHVAQL